MSAVVKDSIAKLNQEQGKPWRLPRDNRETFTMAIHVILRFVKCNWKLGKDAKKKQQQNIGTKAGGKRKLDENGNRNVWLG